ncbi:MAG: carboxypeptidase regulatory-like domain-containing protein [Blastocatellia bacterium]|nr:carboxypeptidase regulatory-like domain-containing protein [Blastocatellia bacterium]
MWLRSFAALVCATLLVSLTTYAQVSINGSLRGRVSDPAAAGLAGVSLTLTNTATATTQKAVADNNGEYQFARVTPGIYALTAEKDGFKRAQRENIVIAVNENAIADLVLSIGQISETVTVEAGAALVQAQSVELSGLVSERRVKDLPLNGRNFVKLIQLAPGVGNPGSANNPSINGGRAVTNSYVVDGIGSNDERLNTGFVGVNGSNTDLGQNVPNLISTEAIQEYRIITSNADATFGRGSGGNINLVTKSGGNQWHGSAYEYLRNDALDAADYFYKANPRPQFRTPDGNGDGKAKTPPFKQNLYGGTFGGRILRDRHFFFGSYEGFQQRRLNQTASNLVVPNADLLRFVPGDLGRFFKTYFIDRGIIPASGNPAGTFTPLSAAERNAIVTAGFPAAFFDGNAANGEAGTVQISAAPPINIEQNAFLVRTDHHLSEKLTANVRYSFARSFVTAGSASPLDTQVAPRQYQSAAIQFNYNLTPAQALEIRGGVLRNRFQQFTQGGIDQRLRALGVSSEYGILVTAGPSSAPFFRAAVNGAFIDNQTTPQLSLLHTWQRGNMTWRSGADLRSIHNNVANISSGQPLFEFTNSLVGANGVYGANPQATEAVTVSTRLTSYGNNGSGPTTPMRGYRSRQQEYFVQNDWRAHRNLTLNLGLRYSFFGVWSEVNNALSNLFAVDGSGNVVPDVNPFAFGRTQNRITRLTDDLRYYNPDYNNFQPRLGLAYDLFGKGRTILRAGYGWYYDRLIQIQFTAAVGNVPYAISSNTANVPFRLTQALPITAAANPAITGVNPEIENPRTSRWNVAVEQQVGKDTSVTVAYVGMRTDNLWSQAQPNGFGGFPTAARPDPRFTTQQRIDNLNLSRYRALQVTAKRRFAQGVDFTAAYTFGEAKDNNSRDSFTTFPTFLNSGANPAQAGVQGTGANFVARDPRADFGLSEFDVRHNLTFTHVLELPIGRGRALLGDAKGVVNAVLGGWAVNGLAVLRSGEPVNIVRGVDFNDDGDATADRPALASGSLNDLYRKGAGERTQFFIPQADALTRLATPTTIDPNAMIARNALRAPRVLFYDMALLKRFVVKERYRVGFEANFFNLFNRAIFGAPVSNLSNALFGRVTSNLLGTNPRQIQFGLKVSF